MDRHIIKQTTLDTVTGPMLISTVNLDWSEGGHTYETMGFKLPSRAELFVRRHDTEAEALAYHADAVARHLIGKPKPSEQMEGMAAPKDMPEQIGPFCGVLALAVFAGITFMEAWDHLRIEGERNGRWKGGSNVMQREAILKRLGVPFEEVETPRPMRLETWARRYAKPGALYMVRMRGHVVTVKDGHILDQNGLRPVSSSWCRRKVVTYVIKAA